MTLDALGWVVAAVLAVALSLAVRYVQSLRARLQRWDADPGPLNDAALRQVLGRRGLFRASPTLDRVQDAFERLIRERDAAKPYMP